MADTSGSIFFRNGECVSTSLTNADNLAMGVPFAGVLAWPPLLLAVNFTSALPFQILPPWQNYREFHRWVRDDTTALITYQEQLNPSALQFRYNLRCTVTAPLFRAGACQIDIGGWDEALANRFFHRLEKMPSQSIWYRTRLGPIPSFRNISGKRCMDPLTLRRHYVLMAHEQDRLLRAFSFQ